MKQETRPEAHQQAHAREESRAWKVLFFVTLINSAHAALSVVGLPAYATSIGLSNQALGVLLTAFPVAAAVSAFAIGALSDYCNRKSLLQTGLITLGISLCLHAFARDFPTLLALRCLAGLGTGLLLGLPATLLSDCFHRKRQQSLTSKTLCGYAIGQTIGIPVGIALLEWIDFLSLASGIGAIALLCLPFTQLFLPQPHRIQSKPQGYLSNYTKRTLELFSNGQFLLISFSSFLSFASLSLFYVVFALWLFDAEGLRPREIAPMYLIGGLLQIFAFAFIVSRLSKFQPRLVIGASLLLNALLFAVAYFALQNLFLAGLLFALTLGVVSLRIPGFHYIVHHTGTPDRKGLRVSLTQSCNQLGKASGAALAGFLYSHFQAHEAILASAALTLLCGALILALKPEEKGLPHVSKPSADSTERTENRRKGRLWHTQCSLKMSSKQLASEYQSRKM